MAEFLGRMGLTRTSTAESNSGTVASFVGSGWSVLLLLDPEVVVVATSGFLLNGGDMALRYFQKELPDSPITIFGHPMRFDFLPTEDPNLIAELENCIRRSVGGISEISKERFDDEVKKKEQEKLLGNSSKPPQRRTELTAFQLGNPGAAEASRFAARQRHVQPPAPQIQHPMPDPIEVPAPSSFQVPPVAKMKDLKAMADRAKPK